MNGYVYLIRVVDHGAYKIGCSVDPARRLPEIQRNLDVKLELVVRVYADNYENAEFHMQQKYQRYRLSRDWFALPDWAVEEIKEMANARR